MTRATITVNLSGHQPNCPLGLLLAPLITSGHDGGDTNNHHENNGNSPSSSPIHSHHTVLIGWTRPYNKLGLIQKSGQVRIGDRLVEINGVSVRQWTFEKIVRVLRCFGGGGGGSGDYNNYNQDTSDSIQIKSLGFEVLKDYESGIGYEDRNFRVAAGAPGSHSYRMKRLYCLNSFVRSYKDSCMDNDVNLSGEHNQNGDGNGPDRIANNDASSKKKEQQPVVRYEVKCNLLIRHHQGNDEELNWSVWKRYSEFKELHDKLMTGYEWIMNRMNDGRGISFPSKHVMGFALYGKLNDAVLQKRQMELDAYWTILQSQSYGQDLFDFGDPSSRRYAKDMADFLEVEKYLHTEGTGSITSHPPRIRRFGSNDKEIDTSLELNLSNIVHEPETEEANSGTPNLHVAELRLDDPTGRGELGEIIVKERLGAASKSLVSRVTVTGMGMGTGTKSRLNTSSSRSMVSRTSTRTGRKSSRKKKGVPAKPAFQRMLLDDM